VDPHKPPQAPATPRRLLFDPIFAAAHFEWPNLQATLLDPMLALSSGAGYSPTASCKTVVIDRCPVLPILL
jgi:hypothetical protein